MYMGIFEPLLAAFTRLDMTLLAGVGLGFLLAAAALIRLAEFLFRRFHGMAYYTVLGFLTGSMLIVIPDFRSGRELTVGLALFAGSAILSFFLTRIKSGSET